MGRAEDQHAGPPPPGNRPLRVCILAHYTVGGGGLSVARNLIPAIAKAAPRHAYLITVQKNAGLEETAAGVPGARVVVAGPWRGLLSRWWWEARRLPRIVSGLRPDVILSFGNRGLPKPPCPQAVLVQHAGLFYPSRHYRRDTLRGKLVNRQHCRELRASLPRTQLVFCQTKVAAERMRSTYGYRGRLAICPNAVSRFTLAGEGPVEIPASLAPHAGRFKLLCLTRYYAHKNLEIIPELFARFAAELKDVTAVLTIAADQHPGAARLLRRIRRLGLGDHVVNVGPLAQEELAAYYAHCQAMFLPTLLESFSGTYLEAMHFGAPILTSDLDFARVVCEDAAVYFDPWDAASVKDAIVRLRNDAALRQRIVATGRARLETMVRSWDQVAAGVVEALEEIARAPDDGKRP